MKGSISVQSAGVCHTLRRGIHLDVHDAHDYDIACLKVDVARMCGVAEAKKRVCGGRRDAFHLYYVYE
jgi:hypothetical protein